MTGIQLLTSFGLATLVENEVGGVVSVTLESGYFSCRVAVALTTRPCNLQKPCFHFRSVSLIKWAISSYENITIQITSEFDTICLTRPKL